MHDHGHDDHAPDGGLALDLPQLLGRRRLLTLLGAAGAVLAVGCSSDDGAAGATSVAGTSGTSGTTGTTGTAADPTTPATDGSTSTSTSTSSGGSTASSATETTGADATVADLECTTIAQETPGPFPGDGSNGPNVLAEADVVRSDIRSSIGSGSATATGVPLSITLAAVDSASGCAALAGAAVYVWHCDAEGRYSMYSDGVTEENYLRGLLETGSDGRATFQSIFPGAYPGRWPHVHFEVYSSLDAAVSGQQPITTSQIALPPELCEAVYATAGYEQSARDHPRTTLDSDGVFRDDGGATQLPSAAGSVDAGFSVELVVAV